MFYQLLLFFHPNKKYKSNKITKAIVQIIVAIFIINFMLLPQISIALTVNNWQKATRETKIQAADSENNRQYLANESIKYSRYITVTAYSSSPEQADATPFITAIGTRVRDGIIAANFLPIGTKVRFPEYSGRKIYIVEDRMNPRYYYQADIWMPGKNDAQNFGLRWLKIEILAP